MEFLGILLVEWMDDSPASPIQIRQSDQEGVGPLVGRVAVPLGTVADDRGKRFKVENATAVIWKTLLVSEQSFRRLDAPELAPEVAEVVTYVNGERAKRGNEKAAA